jgi:predicted nuclease of restriction endonuclease-like (RecB) superfamily
MTELPSNPPIGYASMLQSIKARIRTAQVKAVMSANREMVLLYWDIGRMIDERQNQEGWGAAVIPRLSHDIRNELPEVKGFSARNIDRMVAFYREYPSFSAAISPPPVAKILPVEARISISTPIVSKLQDADGEGDTIVPQLAAQIPWAHNVILIQKVKDLPIRAWYMRQTIEQGWSRDVLSAMIQSAAHERQGSAVTNFADRLPPAQSDLAQQTLKDPYIFDFLTLDQPFRERELETGLVRHLQKFLVELGQGFAFVGRQYHLDVGDDDFYLDLLFYHLKLRCFFVIDLKRGSFKPEYAGKMNFYLGVVDDRLRHETDRPTIGLILCQEKNRVVAEYALRDMQKPIGISEYQLTRALPSELQSALPTIEQIELELSGEEGTDAGE